MAGDINLFLDTEEADEDCDNVTALTTGEINVMIVEEQSKRKGLATESLYIFMSYSIHSWGMLPGPLYFKQERKCVYIKTTPFRGAKVYCANSNYE